MHKSFYSNLKMIAVPAGLATILHTAPLNYIINQICKLFNRPFGMSIPEMLCVT